jgi:hypothetical protein
VTPDGRAGTAVRVPPSRLRQRRTLDEGQATRSPIDVLCLAGRCPMMASMHRGPMMRLVPHRVMAVAALLSAVIGGAAAPAARATADLSPGKFAEVSTGIALIKTYGCGGRPIALGTGFLVGDSVVMTARHVVRGACRVRVSVNGEAFTSRRWGSWYGGHTSVSAADIATIELDHAETTGAHVFRIRSTSPPFGTNISAIGYPLGNRLSLNQGKLVRRWRVNGAPVIVLHMIGAHGGSGSPFLDDAGRVVGILQVGLSSNASDESASFLYGLDLVRWWGPRARVDLCHAYPNGGIAGCAPSSPPPPPPPPPPAPPVPHMSQCWAQYDGGSSSNWNPTSTTTTLAASDLLARGVTNFAEVATLDRAPTSDLFNAITLTLIQPNGQPFTTATFQDWSTGDTEGGFNFNWTFQDGSLFFQHPEVTGQGIWTFKWTGLDGSTCTNQVTVS